MADSEAAIIIKKVKKGGGEGHHGGAWKVAYADFVTAMMAFFLLMWLLNATTEEQRLGIADYFAPSVAPDATSGSGGVLGGTTVESEGAMQDQTTAPSVTVELTTPVEGDGDQQGHSDQTEAAETGEQTTTQMATAAPQPPGTAAMPPAETAPSEAESQTPSDAEAEKLIAELEEEQFRTAEYQLRQAIQQVPDLKSLAQNLIIDRTPEGMRIQLVDQNQLSMFPLGSANMLDHTRKLLDVVAQIVSQMPNKISISGHTDSTPFANDKGYSNWELSADRANASRRELLSAGLSPDRISYVTGKADQDPLLPGDPSNPRNRRISIVLLREHPVPSGADTAPAGSAPATTSEPAPAAAPAP